MNAPPATILPSACIASALTVLSNPVHTTNVVSLAQVVVRRVIRLCATHAYVVNAHPTTILLSACIANELTVPLNHAQMTNVVSLAPVVDKRVMRLCATHAYVVNAHHTTILPSA